MFVPVLRSGVKQRDQQAIDVGRQIWAFVKIAPVAGKAQIKIFIRPAVLSCHDMFNVKSNKRENVLMTSAILAAILCTLADPSSCGSVNGHWDQPEMPEITARAFSWSRLIKLMARTQASYSDRSSAVSVPSVDFSARSSSFC